jgi:hypothetical protein
MKYEEVEKHFSGEDEDIVRVMCSLPSDMHRVVKSEAALRKVKINTIMVEAVEQWIERWEETAE